MKTDIFHALNDVEDKYILEAYQCVEKDSKKMNCEDLINKSFKDS